MAEVTWVVVIIKPHLQWATKVVLVAWREAVVVVVVGALVGIGGGMKALPLQVDIIKDGEALMAAGAAGAGAKLENKVQVFL